MTDARLRLDGRVALVTGAASGLGRAIASRLRAEGCEVVLTDVQVKAGDALATELTGLFLEQDVADEARWRDVVNEIERRFGRLDIAIHNAGILGATEGADPEHELLENWRRVFAVNVESVFLGCRTVLGLMRVRGGAIVNVSSMGSELATPKAPAYGASKAAVRHFTRSLAQYCARQRLGIRCNSVHPGIVRTPLLEAAVGESATRSGVDTEALFAASASRVPLGDLTRPEDVAASVAYSCSDDARHITGSAIFVDGGYVNCNTFNHGD